MSNDASEHLRPIIERMESDEEWAEKLKTFDRMLLCVKSCEGINPEAVPIMKFALERMLSFFVNVLDQSDEVVGSMTRTAQEALAKAKEGQ